MELEPLLARLAQAEKDIAELRAKVFFLEAVKHEQVKHQPSALPNWDPYAGIPDGLLPTENGGVGHEDFGAEAPPPERKLSPFSLTGKLRPKTYDEESTETVNGSFLENLNAEMFDGNS